MGGSVGPPGGERGAAGPLTPTAPVDVTQLLDPELRPAFDGFVLPPLDAHALKGLRGAAFPAAEPSDAVVRSEHVVPGDPSVRVRVHRPLGVDGPLPAVVTIHGGGYVIGSYDMDGGRSIAGAPRLGCPRRLVEYRLAPETPYPGPLEDCYAGVALDLRQRGRARHRPGPHRYLRTQRRRRSGGRAWPCWPATAARCRWPSSCSTAPCSTTAR